MPDSRNNPAKQSDWLKLMAEGQLTRDAALKTSTEIEEDKRRAAELESRRQALRDRKLKANQP